MLGSRLTQWTLLVGLTACTSDPKYAQGARPMDTIGAGTGTGAVGTGTGAGTGGSNADASGGAGGAGTGGSTGGGPGGSAADAAMAGDGGGLVLDANVVIHDDATAGPVACSQNRATVGSIVLRAVGATPMAFAAAYNAELGLLTGAGPLLIVLSGVNDANPTGWLGSFGALTAREGGSVGFAGKHADVPFTMSATRAIQIPPSSAAFELRFVPPASDVLLPVASIELAGTLSRGCGSLVVEKAKLLVPIAAGSIAFHGSTIAALMGAPSETLGGQAASAWALELMGAAQEVHAPSVLDDGGSPQ